jgi:phosphoglycolate phosphatase
MPLPLQHIIWDWNGTLVNDVENCLVALNAMLSRRCLPVVSLEDYRTHFTFPVRDYYEQLGFDFERDDWHGVSVEFFEVYDRGFKDVRLREGMRELLESLHPRIDMSVLSVSEASMLEQQVKAQDVHHLFYSVNGTDDFYARGKLEQGRRWLSTHGVDPARVVLVGDTVHDHEVADALGIQCLLIADGHMSPERLKASGSEVVDSLDDLQDRLYSSI